MGQVIGQNGLAAMLQFDSLTKLRQLDSILFHVVVIFDCQQCFAMLCVLWEYMDKK